MSRSRTQVTVIGGYLGAGKTTLVNHLLRTAEERIAVLVNDFGDINIDLDLIESATDDTLELSNGCICCSMVDGFSEALDRITALDPPPDRLVVEASGVADPTTVAAYGHGPGLRLDAVIVLVDAETVCATIDDKYVGQTVRQQLGAAEVLVLNKADLVSPQELEETTEWLSDTFPHAFVLTTTESRVAPEVLFGRPSTQSFGAVGHVHHHPERTFTTRNIEAGPVSRQWVESLMTELDADTTVRCKGLVQLDEDATRPFILQRVGRRWSLRRSPSDWPGTPATRLVVIEVSAEAEGT